MVEPPSVAAGTARAAQIAGGPLAAALLPTALLEAPEPLPALATRRVAEAIASQGWCICRGGLDPEVSRAAAREAAALHDEGRMEMRGFVRQGKLLPLPSPDRSNRDDVCTHLGLDDLPAGLAAVDEALERFAVELFDELEYVVEPGAMGGGPRGERLRYTGRGDLMVACYPGDGAAHGIHIDNSGAPHATPPPRFGLHSRRSLRRQQTATAANATSAAS